MGWVKPLVGIFAVGAVASIALGDDDEDTVVVNRVIDGDTIDVDIDGENTRVRLLNIDTPEIGHNGGPANVSRKKRSTIWKGGCRRGLNSGWSMTQKGRINTAAPLLGHSLRTTLLTPILQQKD